MEKATMCISVFGRTNCLLVSLVLWLCLGRVSSHTLYQWIVDSQTRFNYDPDPRNGLGVYNWPRTYPEECGGLHQSPVDIQTRLVRYNVVCSCPVMHYDSPIIRGHLVNNGHSPDFSPDEKMAYRLTNVPYRPGVYLLNDFHLHYGGVRGRFQELQGLRFRGSGTMSAGSEHTVDGLRFEGELHLVFYNSKYRNMEQADSKPDGLVVVVILVQKIPDSMGTTRFSEFLNTYIPRIAPYQTNISVDVDMRMLLSRACEFYTYAGSTTTPQCHESVRWLILREPLRVTESSWFQLTKLVSRGDFNSRFGNYRTTQPLNDRVIEANFARPPFMMHPVPSGDPQANPEVVDLQMRTPTRNRMVPSIRRNMATPPSFTMPPFRRGVVMPVMNPVDWMLLGNRYGSSRYSKLMYRK